MPDNQWLDRPPMTRLRQEAAQSHTFRAGEIVLARAPGRLDVMGGIADYSGSLVCELPLAVAAGVAAQHRDDGCVVVRSEQVGRQVTLNARQLATDDHAAVRDMFSGDDAWARHIVGCVWWLADQQGVGLEGGVTLLLDSDVPLGGGVSSSAAIEVATMSALTTLLGHPLQPLDLAVACQAVENLVVGAPCGVMDQVTSAMGREGAMLEILCQPGPDHRPAQVLGDVPVPPGYAFVGIHSGVSHEVSGDPYTDTRVAAFMAQKILSLIDGDVTDGCLANLNADAYRRLHRERLPETLSGDAFVESYQSTNDPVTRVNPQKTYHVRAAADHHVLEMARVQRFVELIKTANGDHSSKPIEQAGALMYASHASYRDCARLGHPMTDRLVEMVRARGPESGLFGAKITGGGSGGTVAILLSDDEAARIAIEEIRGDYAAETGRATTLFDGTGPGAAEVGAAWISKQD